MADDYRSVSEYLGIGAAAAAIVIVCGGLGLVADLGLDTTPVFLFVGLLVGIVGGVVFVYGKFRDSLRRPD